MKKFLFSAMALIAIFAIGSSLASAGKKNTKKVRSFVTIEYVQNDNDPYYQQSHFKGRVRAGGKKPRRIRRICKRGRIVKVKNAEGGIVGKDRTNKKGRWRTGVNFRFEVPGEYFAKTPRKVKKITRRRPNGTKKTKRIVCRSAKTGNIEVGNP